MKNRIRMMVGISVLVGGMFVGGCSSTGNEKAIEEPKEKIVDEELTKQDIEVSSNEDAKKESDKQVLKDYSDITMGFISETSMQFAEYMKNEEIPQVIGYAMGLTKPSKLQEVESKMDEMYGNLQTEDAKDLFLEIRDVYDEYVRVLQEISKGKINDELARDIVSLTQKVPNLITEVDNF